MEAKRSWARYLGGLATGLAIAIGLGGSGLLSAATIGESRQPPPYKWTKFVSVDGQPEPVPVEWVSTPEGKFAHSIKIPNPVPKDSGYRRGMSAKEYFDHLCKNEAGEFVFKTADNVEGILFMRPPARPTDYDLMDRYRLEAPSFERIFSMKPEIAARGAIFGYRFAEEPHLVAGVSRGYLHASTYHPRLSLLTQVQQVDKPRSRFGVTWRGLRRENDRENSISGTEIIVLDLSTHEVIAVLREFGITGLTSNTQEGIWWLNAAKCTQYSRKYPFSDSGQLSDFVRSVLRPK